MPCHYTMMGLNLRALIFHRNNKKEGRCSAYRHTSFLISQLSFHISGYVWTNSECPTGPSYQNESSDSVSRKLLDEFENAFNTKQILVFDEVFVTAILLNSTIYSTLLVDLSILMQCPFLFLLLQQSESCSKACTAHFANAATLLFFLLLREQNGGTEKVLNPSIRGIKGIQSFR